MYGARLKGGLVSRCSEFCPCSCLPHLPGFACSIQATWDSPFSQALYPVTTINVSRKWIEWAEWAASLCTANSPFPVHVYCSHPVVHGTFSTHFFILLQKSNWSLLLSFGPAGLSVPARGGSVFTITAHTL